VSKLNGLEAKVDVCEAKLNVCESKISANNYQALESLPVILEFIAQ